MKVTAVILLAVVAVASSFNFLGDNLRSQTLKNRVEMFSTLQAASNETITAPMSIKCDICKYALGKAYSIGCGKAGGIIADLCGDFEPACALALDELCKICETHCDVPNVIDDVCHDVHLC